MPRRDHGFSLIETLVATALLAGALVSIAQLSAIAVRNNAIARQETVAAVLATQKIEQLYGDPSLSSSPNGTLDSDVGGFVDYPGLFVRRWSVAPMQGTAAFLIEVRIIEAGGVRVLGESRLAAVTRRGP